MQANTDLHDVHSEKLFLTKWHGVCFYYSKLEYKLSAEASCMPTSTGPTWVTWCVHVQRCYNQKWCV